MFIPAWVFWLVVYGVFCFFNPKLWQFTQKWMGIAFLSVFTVLNSPFFLCYWLATGPFCFEKDQWQVGAFTLIGGFGIYCLFFFIYAQLFVIGK